MKNFYQFLLKLEAGEAPPAPGGDPLGGGGPPATPAPAPGGDPLGGMGGPPGGGPDPMGGGIGGAPGATAGPRKAINVTTWEDALRIALGNSAHRPDHSPEHKSTSSRNASDKEEKKPRSLIK